MSEEDPLAVRRQDVATPLWIRGYGAESILQSINTWLESEEQPPITLEQLLEDRDAILAAFERDYRGAPKSRRLFHVATLHRVQREAWIAYDAAKDDGREPTGYLGVIRSTVDTMARLEDLWSSQPEDRETEDTALDLVLRTLRKAPPTK